MSLHSCRLLIYLLYRQATQEQGQGDPWYPEECQQEDREEVQEVNILYFLGWVLIFLFFLLLFFLGESKGTRDIFVHRRHGMIEGFGSFSHHSLRNSRLHMLQYPDTHSELSPLFRNTRKHIIESSILRESNDYRTGSPRFVQIDNLSAMLKYSLAAQVDVFRLSNCFFFRVSALECSLVGPR